MTASPSAPNISIIIHRTAVTPGTRPHPPAALHLPRPLHLDGDDVEAVAAELAGPGASLADPLQQAVLVGVTHRTITPTRVQQVALETRERAKMSRWHKADKP